MSAPDATTVRDVFPNVHLGVVGCIVDVIDCLTDDVQPDKALVDDLDFDSLALVELLLSLEERFAIDIPDEAVGDQKVRTVADVEQLVERLLRA